MRLKGSKAIYKWRPKFITGCDNRTEKDKNILKKIHNETDDDDGFGGDLDI